MAVILILGIILIFSYFVSLRRHPLATCTMCSGTGREYGHIYTYSQRRCRKCGGSGRYDRLGTRMFHGGSGNFRRRRFFRRW
jgi:DnaJ-class molecular chaperone